MEHNAPEAGDKLASAVAINPTCRYLGDDHHVCANSYGEALREGQVCHAEARTQLAEVIDRNVDRWLAQQDLNEADADARLTACERWEDEAA